MTGQRHAKGVLEQAASAKEAARQRPREQRQLERAVAWHLPPGRHAAALAGAHR